METGFSTWGLDTPPPWPGHKHSEDDQEIFINSALPIIRERVREQNMAHPQNKIIISGWYELRGDAVWGDVEGNFGVLKDNWSAKRGYDDLQRQILQFY